ncbi:unnamed protein product, partial [Notodromas monacha]
LSSGDVTGLRHLKLKTPGTICSVGGKGKTLFLCGRPRWLAVMPSPLATNPSTEPEPFPTSSNPQTFGSTTTLRRSKLSLVESFSLGGDVYEIPGRGAESEGNEVYLDDPVFPTAVLVCWKGIEGCDGAAPWHPTSSKILDSANVLLYTCDSERRVQLSGWLKTEGSVVNASFIATCVSDQASISFCTLELPLLYRENLFVKLCEYDSGVSGYMGMDGGVWQVGVNQIPLTGQLTASAFTPLATTAHTVHLVMTCQDRSLIFHTFTRWSATEPVSEKLTLEFVGSCVNWHPDGIVFGVGGSSGEVQVFDLGLNVIRVVTHYHWLKPVTSKFMHLGDFSRHRLPIYSLKWTPVPKCKSLFKHPSPDTTGLLVQTLRGPFCFLLFTGTGFPSPWGLPSLTSMYLKFELVSCAVSLLSAVGWNGDGTEAMAALSFICNKLMKASLTSENLMTIQAALGTFHASKKPLSSAVMARHGGFVRNLTRRFFLLLLKHQDWVTSFRLALDLADPDLFMDLHHCGKAVGNLELASSALSQMHLLTGGGGGHQSRINPQRPLLADEDKYKVFSGSVGGTFNVLEKQLKNLKLSLRGIESPASTSTSAGAGVVGVPVIIQGDDAEDEEEEGVQVVHFGVV